MKKNKGMLTGILLIAAFSFLSGCKDKNGPNVEICSLITLDSGESVFFCRKRISKEERDVTLEQAQQEKFVGMSLDDYVETQRWYREACK